LGRKSPLATFCGNGGSAGKSVECLPYRVVLVGPVSRRGKVAPFPDFPPVPIAPGPRDRGRPMEIDIVPSARHDFGRVSQKADSDPLLRLIAFFKLVKAVLFFAAGIGVLKLFNKDVGERLEHLLDHLHVDSDNRYAQECIGQVGRMTDTNLKLAALSAVSFFYAALFGTEGTGLFLRKRWAEWFVVIVTGSLLPVEIYEIVHKISAFKIILTLLNLLIVGYLIIVIRRKQEKG
jgi:uncharacterized membrane protein (DUF2068 family)